MLEDKDFELVEETPVTNEEDEVVITQDDFELVEVDSSVHEQKFQTKPTTFIKDALKRFKKNKSSVAAFFIVGILLILSFAVPIFDRSNTKEPNPKEYYLAPKLFDNNGTGFWDGTSSYKNIPLDISEMPEAKTEEEKQEHWWPSAQLYPQRSAITKKKISDLQYVNDISSSSDFAKEGYVHFGYDETLKEGETVDFSTETIPSLTLEANDLYLTRFDTYDVDKINAFEGKNEFALPRSYSLGESAFYFLYQEVVEDEIEFKEVKLVDYASRHDIGSAVDSYKKEKINISEIITAETGKTTFMNASFAVRMMGDGKSNRMCTLIGGIAFENNFSDENMGKVFDDMSFNDATKVVATIKDDGYSYWKSTGLRKIYMAKVYFCSFTYDTYEAAFGTRVDKAFSITDLLSYEEKGWMSFKSPEGIPTLMKVGTAFQINTNKFTCKILDAKKCPVVEELTIDDFVYPTPRADGIASGTIVARAKVCLYKKYGYSSMPRYLMGTDKSGRDMLKYVFEGLRTSLLLGIICFAINFTIGVIWGSISGYFGGTTDLIMERITDILGRVPWIVMMTLILMAFKSNFGTFIFAMCFTGWIGTAGLTRTQFYRFRGREYVLASRTLGASDARLIYKHILPNGLGTIITVEVLMIPSVIFDEANIAYLGLGFKNLASLGVILSDNQAELMTNSYLLIFPSIIIALLMISFNLFGNGLRDAVNPSLKGEE